MTFPNALLDGVWHLRNGCFARSNIKCDGFVVGTRWIRPKAGEGGVAGYVAGEVGVEQRHFNEEGISSKEMWFDADHLGCIENVPCGICDLQTNRYIDFVNVKMNGILARFELSTRRCAAKNQQDQTYGQYGR